MILVRLLLFLSLAAIGVALLLWLIKRDRRYLRFIGLTLKFTVLVLLVTLLWFAGERLLGRCPDTSDRDLRGPAFRKYISDPDFRTPDLHAIVIK